jgi:hypothetical protein
VSSKLESPPETWKQHAVMRVLCRPLTGPYELTSVSSLTAAELSQRARARANAGTLLVDSSKLHVYNTSTGYAVARAIIPGVKICLSPLLYLSARPSSDPGDSSTVRMSWVMPRFYVGLLAFIPLGMVLALLGASLEGSQFSRDFSTEVNLASRLLALGLRMISSAVIISVLVRIAPLKWTLNLAAQAFQLSSVEAISE